VVSVDLPEIRPIEQAGLITIAENAGEFAEQIKGMIRDQSPELIKARQAFARENTWADRYRITTSEIVSIFPKVSILIAIHNNLELNKSCLSSILGKTDYPNYEVILVDNASTDGSREYVLELSGNDSRVRVILNEENESFAKANNRALGAAEGEYVVYLNNDTIVTQGWITRLLQHLKSDPTIGMIGPVSNAVGNEAKIEVDYTSPEGIDAFASLYCRKHEGEIFDIPVLALFCTMIKRSIMESVGRLDESYGVGMFEDDDLCVRIKNAGFRLVCAEDVFIHHFQQGTFKLLPPDVFKQVFESNRRRFEEKWGPWKPHQQRKPAAATKVGSP
jgi:GT2 family glycosyltransferase